MNKTTRQQVAHALRAAAAKLTAGAAEAFIKKFAKKAKIGEYDPHEIVNALNVMEPGWKIEDAVEAMPLRGQEAVKLDKDAIGKAGFSGTPVDVSVYDATIMLVWGWDFSPNHPRFGGTRPDESVIKDAINETLRQIKSQVEFAKNPTNPKLDQTYADKLPKPKIELDLTNPYGDKMMHSSVELKLTGVKRGVGVVNIVSPSGAKISLIGKPQRSGALVFDSPTLWTMLYKSDVPEKAAAFLAQPDVAAKEVRREQLRHIKDDPGNVGTCPACENMQKLSWSKKTKDGLPTMVLHGYERPGVGYINGKCFGVGFAPFELSVEGAVGWRERLETILDGEKANLAHNRSLSHLLLWFPAEDNISGVGKYEEVKLSDDGTTETTGRTAGRSELRKTHDRWSLDRNPKAYFESLKDAIVRGQEGLVKQIEHDIKHQTQRINGWSAVPLPGTSEEDQKFIAEQKSGVCPGSGTPNHDNAHVKNFMSKWAHCDVCKQSVSVTSSGVLRAHPFVKKKG